MPKQILMPALSPGQEAATLTKWLVHEGESVTTGDILAEIETDKTTLEFENAETGVIQRLLVAAGTTGIRVGTPIATLVPTDAALASRGPGLAPASRKDAAGDEAAPDGVSETAAPPLEANGWPAGTRLRTQTVRDALRDAMAEEMRRDGDVFLIGEDVGSGQGTYGIGHTLLEEFGAGRVVDTPTTEQGFAGLAVGAAFGGLKPIVEFMTFNFALQALDQIVNSAAKTRYMSGGSMSAAMVFRGPNGAAARTGAQHSQDFSAWFAHVPGLKVAMPYAASDAKGLLKSAIRDPGPVIFLENEGLYGRTFDVPEIEDFTLPFGKARIWREGRDVTLVSFGIGMVHTLAAAEALAGDGIEAEVIDLRTLRPMDTAAVVASVRKTHRCVTVEEGWPVGCIGNHLSAVLMREAFDHLDAPVLNVTGKDVPMPYAANLEKLSLPSADEVAAAAREVCYR